MALPIAQKMAVPLESLNTLEKLARSAAHLVTEGLKAAPKWSGSYSSSANRRAVSCCVLLPLDLQAVRQNSDSIASRFNLSFHSYIRFKYPKLLDAIVAFANSTFSPQQLQAYQSCECKNHDSPQIEHFSDVIYGDARGWCESYGPLHDSVLHIFMTIAGIVTEVKDNPGNDDDPIKPGGNARPGGKWPSSPSKFIPHGPEVAVSSFMFWARLIKNAIPIQALSALTFCCPALEPAIKENKDLLPLIASLLSTYISSIRTLELDKLSNQRGTAVENDFSTFYNIMNENWFVDQIFAAQTDKSLAIPLASIYALLTELLPLFDALVPIQLPLSKDTIRDRLGTIGYTIYKCVHSNHPDIAIYADRDIFIHAVFDPEGDPECVRGLAMDLMYLRDQPHCANISCTKMSSEGAENGFKLCAICQSVRYCSKACQTSDWKCEHGHKGACKLLKTILPLSSKYQFADFDPEAEDLFRMYGREIKEAGLTGQDIVVIKKYVAPHMKSTDYRDGQSQRTGGDEVEEVEST